MNVPRRRPSPSGASAASQLQEIKKISGEVGLPRGGWMRSTSQDSSRPKAAPHRWGGIVPVVGALALLAAAGCQRDDVRHYRVPKQAGSGEAAAAMPPAAGPAMGGPAMDPSAVPPPPAVAVGLSWTLPKGWTESRTGGMRFATLVPGVPGKLDVSVIVLPGPAGGEIANVNRWRGQIGLAPVDEAELGRARKELRSAAAPVALFDFTSDGAVKTRMVAGIVFARGNSWFLKMVGDAGPVATARPDFVRFLESLRLDP
jgi:hypothetical protein